MHEHPWGAKSWRENCVQSLMQLPNVHTVKGNMCRHNMKGDGELVFKPTGWCSNSPHILKHMNKLCDKSHNHANLLGGKAAQAAIWPRGLCLSILRGLREQLLHDGVLSVNGFGIVCEEKSYDNEINDTVYFSKFVDTFLVNV